VLIAVVGTIALALAFVQVASDSLCAAAAAPGTFPRRVPVAFGESVYRVLDRIAPASFVETSLALRSLERGDLDAAQYYALRLPASSRRDAVLSKIARARGQDRLALEYSIAAFDGDAVWGAAQKLAARDPQAAYGLEALLESRLRRRTTQPDALAQARWEMGLLANRSAWRKIPGSSEQHAWLHRAFDDFEAAVALAPLSERYAIADANQADLLVLRYRARQLFERAAALDPASADAVAGLGVVALENGDRKTATADLARARALDAGSLMVRALERRLR
jgi:hypothetical protein